METIKARKQGNSITLTVPASFNIPVGTKVEPKLTQEGIFYKFIKDDNFFDFDREILSDLISQGYEGKGLIDKFEEIKKQIPQVLQNLSKEAESEPILTKEEAMKEFDL